MTYPSLWHYWQRLSSFLCDKLGEYEFVGELALTGALRGVPGAISSAMEALKSGKQIIVADENAAELRLISKPVALSQTISLKSVHSWKAEPNYQLQKTTAAKH